MSAAERKAWMTEAMKIAHWFRQNASARYGVPECAGQTGIDTIQEKQQEPTININNQMPAAPAVPNSPSPGATVAADTEGRSLLKTVAPWLLSAAIGSGAWPLYSWLTKQEAIVDADVQGDGSLLQFLQDQGLHLPEGKWKSE